jgi:pyrimidine-specific ribonucleoside hydrolase
MEFRRAAVTAAIVLVVAHGLRAWPTAPEGPASAVPSTSEVRHVVFDTDLAFDDIMALLYLVQRDDVVIDAVTITGTGEAHCDPGVQNALRLLALGGNLDTPVACGRETPLQGTNAFPDEWRTAVDDLSMLDLPQVDRGGDARGATGLLLDTLDGDATLITLGPLTNVAEALRADPNWRRACRRSSRWRGRSTSMATPRRRGRIQRVGRPARGQGGDRGMPVTLVPLDATDDVPFTTFFVDALGSTP